jgi:hypothetical protein
MVQYADCAGLLTNLPTIEDVLDDHASELGHDFIPYRHHVYRVLNLCLAIVGDSRFELEKIALGTSSRPRAAHSRNPNTKDTQGPPTACDSPSSVASGRNRENSVPLRVLHPDQTLLVPNELGKSMVGNRLYKICRRVKIQVDY